MTDPSNSDRRTWREKTAEEILRDLDAEFAAEYHLPMVVRVPHVAADIRGGQPTLEPCDCPIGRNHSAGNQRFRTEIAVEWSQLAAEEAARRVERIARVDAAFRAMADEVRGWAAKERGAQALSARQQIDAYDAWRAAQALHPDEDPAHCANSPHSTHRGTTLHLDGITFPARPALWTPDPNAPLIGWNEPWHARYVGRSSVWSRARARGRRIWLSFWSGFREFFAQIWSELTGR